MSEQEAEVVRLIEVRGAIFTEDELYEIALMAALRTADQMSLHTDYPTRWGVAEYQKEPSQAHPIGKQVTNFAKVLREYLDEIEQFDAEQADAEV